MLEKFTPKRIAYFWSRIDCSGGPDACWPWLYSTAGKGYGSLSIGPHNGRMRLLAHRVAWVLTYGPMTKPFVCHRCDNPLCCNPAHLFQCTCSENLLDMFAKGRHPKAGARLTPDDVREMRRRWASGEGLTLLGRAFGVTRSNAWLVITHKTWRDVE